MSESPIKNIIISHGIYAISLSIPYHRTGFYHADTQSAVMICEKLRDYLAVKGQKMQTKYGCDYLEFTHAIDLDNHIETIALTHPVFDVYDEIIGENIVYGRLARMRGDVKKTIYEIEHYIEEFVAKDEFGFIIWSKEIHKKKVKRDSDGNMVIKRVIHHKPYNLDKRHRIYSEKEKCLIAGELLYPFIAKEQLWGI